MKKILQKSLFLAACFSFSHLYAFAPSPEMIKLYEGRMAIPFGTDKTSEVYIFTDWNSPDSAKFEPVLEAMTPELMKKAKVYFLCKQEADTENLTIANLSVLAQNPKELGQYFKMRKALFELAAQKKNPSVDDIKAAFLALKINYAPLKKELTETLSKVNKGVTMTMGITQYPTVVLYNLGNSTSKKITVLADITAANVMKELDSLKVENSTPPPAK